ncbi:MAG: type II toxin-antitoxin system Phd/YefM family antitoxin [Chloroflexota bacterium]
MKQIGIRELRQHASVWLREVEAGQSFEVTDRGRPIARLVPARDLTVLERLESEGRLTVPTYDLRDLGDPLPPEPGVPLPSELLEQARADER